MLCNNFLLHLTLIEGIGPAIIQRIIERSDLKESDLYSFSSVDFMQRFKFSEKTAQKLASGLSDTQLLEKELRLIDQHNIQWITIQDEDYPALLKHINLPPIVLYWYGSITWNSSDKNIAVVGSRKANEYGYHATASIIPDLIATNYTIISGGALGIDTLAHELALKYGGKTIAVLGSGLLRPYPSP